MDLKRIGPQEAQKLCEEDGYVIVDVRSMPEYRDGHPSGAYNIPYLHKTPQGMIPNQDFVRIVQSQFPDPESKIVTSCQMGGRSVRAAVELVNLGYKNVVDMRGGFGGERDPTGQVVNPGWKDTELSVETGDPDERSYKEINNRANQLRDEGSSKDTGMVEAPEALPENAEQAPAQGGLNRFASTKRTVPCVRMGKTLPGLKRRPLPGPLGERIYESISAEAWNLWVEHSKMLINEYRIHSADPQAMKLLVEQCEAFFFGEGVTKPEGFVPSGDGTHS